MRRVFRLFLLVPILGIAILALMIAGRGAGLFFGAPTGLMVPEAATDAVAHTSAEAPSPPRIPHLWEPRLQCLDCHGPAGFKPVPADHAGRTVATCSLCHQTREPAWSLVIEGVAAPVAPAPAAPTPAAKPPATPLATPAPAATPAATPPTTPMPAGADPEAGKAVFNQSCSLCHPGGGKGMGPSLKKPDYQGSEEEMTEAIRQGKGAMPAFPASRIGDQQLADIIAYLNSSQ